MKVTNNIKETVKKQIVNYKCKGGRNDFYNRKNKHYISNT